MHGPICRWHRGRSTGPGNPSAVFSIGLSYAMKLLAFACDGGLQARRTGTYRYGCLLHLRWWPELIIPMYHVARLSTCLLHRNSHRAPHGCPSMLNIGIHSLLFTDLLLILRKISWVNTPSAFWTISQTFKKCWLQMTSTIFTLQNRKHMYICKSFWKMLS
jgi:hypothetical protein